MNTNKQYQAEKVHKLNTRKVVMNKSEYISLRFTMIPLQQQTQRGILY